MLTLDFDGDITRDGGHDIYAYREEEDHDQYLLFVIFEENPPADVTGWVMEEV